MYQTSAFRNFTFRITLVVFFLEILKDFNFIIKSKKNSLKSIETIKVQDFFFLTKTDINCRFLSKIPTFCWPSTPAQAKNVELSIFSLRTAHFTAQQRAVCWIIFIVFGVVLVVVVATASGTFVVMSHLTNTKKNSSYQTHIVLGWHKIICEQKKADQWAFEIEKGSHWLFLSVSLSHFLSLFFFFSSLSFSWRWSNSSVIEMLRSSNPTHWGPKPLTVTLTVLLGPLTIVYSVLSPSKPFQLPNTPGPRRSQIWTQYNKFCD